MEKERKSREVIIVRQAEELLRQSLPAEALDYRGEPNPSDIRQREIGRLEALQWVFNLYTPGGVDFAKSFTILLKQRLTEQGRRGLRGATVRSRLFGE